MITATWVQSEIERAMAGPPTRETVYDLSALITVLDYMQRPAADPDTTKAAPPETPEERRRREAVILTSYSADLNARPRIEEIYDALDAVEVNTPEDRQKARDARVWADIIGQGVQR